jgi:hypothetical protein
MEQLAEEFGTRPIPGNVVDFAVASAYAEITSGFSAEATFRTSQGDLTLKVVSPEERGQELLWESYVFGWPWIITDVGQFESTSMGQVFSSPLVGSLTHFGNTTLYEYASQACPTVGAIDIWNSPLRMLLTPSIEPVLLLGLRPKIKIAKNAELAIRRTGMALATEWSEALINKEVTRGIFGYTGRTISFENYQQVSVEFIDYAEATGNGNAGWYVNAIRELDQLAKLSSDWNGYGAEAPNITALSQGRLVLDELNKISLKPDRILPSAVGGVSLCFFGSKKYGEVECYNTGETVAIIKNTSTNWRSIWEVVSMSEAVKRIDEFLRGRIDK